MIGLVSQISTEQVSDHSSRSFEELLPSIERIASYAFRRIPRWRRAELIADVVAAAYTAFVRLIERGLECLIYPSVLAKFGIRRVRVGRQVGVKLNVNDVHSDYCQRKKRFSIEQLSQAAVDNGWEELTEDRKANPSEIAALRVDLHDWLRRLTRFKRRVALRLAIGDTTGDAARHFRVSPARISQLRQELRSDWNEFQATPSARIGFACGRGSAQRDFTVQKR
jgi:hypothetical protein